jgi:DNA-binding transcriptional MerR regulator
VTGNEGVNQPRWSVGALAKVTGLTVRTLHHYDELGLLKPSERTHSGHRRYTEQDVQRLYRIRLLRQLGMSLEEINDVLVDPSHPGALREVLADHLDRLDDQVWQLNALRHRTRNLMEQLNGSWRPDSGELLALLGRISVFDEYLSEEQRISLDNHSEELGEDARKLLDAEWPLVTAQLAEHCRAGTPVDDPEVRRTTQRLFEVVQTFTGGDREIYESMVGFLRERGLGVPLGVLAEQEKFELGDELLDYVGRAWAALPAE